MKAGAIAPLPAAADRRGGYDVEIVTTDDGFTQLRTTWQELVARAQVPHPFLSYEWVRSWWDSFRGDGRLHIVVVRSRGRAIAIAPLMAETARMYGLTVRRLRLLQNDHSPRADFIVAGDPQAAVRSIWKALVEHRDDWDVLQLSQLPQDSPTLKVVSSLADAAGLAHGVWNSGASPYLPLSGSYPEFLQHLTPKFRQNLRNRYGRLRRIAEPELEIVDGGPKLYEALDDVVRLEASGWKRVAGTAISSDLKFRRFYQLAGERLAMRGTLRLMFLTVNGRRIATSFAVCHERRLFLCKTGYDPGYETCSPFKVLMWLLVQYAFDHEITEIDLLGDPEPWKLEWTGATRPHDWLFVFSNTAKARVLYPLKFRLGPALKQSAVGQFVLRALL